MIMRCKWVFNCELVGLEMVRGCPSGPVQKHIRPSRGSALARASCGKGVCHSVSLFLIPLWEEGGQRRQSRKPFALSEPAYCWKQRSQSAGKMGRGVFEPLAQEQYSEEYRRR